MNKIPQLSTAAFFILICTACTQQTAPSDMSITWKTVAAEFEEVNVMLIVSGTMVQTINVGTFSGVTLHQPLVREWWSGSNEILRIERQDETHLHILRTSLDADIPDVILQTIEIPSNVEVQCVDDGGCA